MNGGSTADTCRSRLDGSHASFSGHSAGGDDWRPLVRTGRSIGTPIEVADPRLRGKKPSKIARMIGHHQRATPREGAKQVPA